MISHLEKKEAFFKKSVTLLKKEGYVCIADWFMKRQISAADKKDYIHPIEEGMFVQLETMETYVNALQRLGLKVVAAEDISEQVKKTWDICLEIIAKRELWALALQHGKNCLDFLQAFRAMKAGFSSHSFQYGIIIAKK